MKVSQVLVGILRKEKNSAGCSFYLVDQDNQWKRVEMGPKTKPVGGSLLAALVGNYCEATGRMTRDVFVIDTISVIR